MKVVHSITSYITDDGEVLLPLLKKDVDLIKNNLLKNEWIHMIHTFALSICWVLLEILPRISCGIACGLNSLELFV